MENQLLFCIGMMGGMFDPVHNGHLQTAMLLKNLAGLDQVHLIPCGNPVHRNIGLASVNQRCEMIALAVRGIPWMQLDRRECDRAGPSWTWLTLQSMRNDFPAASISVMMGMDAFISLPTWFRWQEIFDLGHVIVSARPEVDYDPSAWSDQLLAEVGPRRTENCELLQTRRNGCVLIASIATPAISSTGIRAKIHDQESLENLLPDAVINYVNEHQLYS